MLILASASPRRHELLTAAGLEHRVQPTHVPEEREARETPEAFVRRLALEKALPVTMLPGDIVIAADTVVSIGDQIFGKPLNRDDANRMLRALSGRSHWVHTGVCLRSISRKILDISSTEVFFLPLTEAVIKEYTRSGESEDKAGAYAIQGQASRFVEKIHGCYHNVVGLPVSLVYRHLQTLGWPGNNSLHTAVP